MPYDLSFSHSFTYDAGLPGIEVTVALQLNEVFTSFAAKIDTGASNCIFKRAHGETIGLEIETGTELIISTATGHFSAFGHFVTMMVGDFDFDVMVYFAKDYSFNRNVLGRNGFLNLVQLGLIDYDGKLFLSRYNS